MGYKIKWRPAARKEYRESIDWYLERSDNAAIGFIDAVRNGINRIKIDPDVFKIEYRNYHEYQLQVYPFTIVYIVEDTLNLITIIAIYHQNRNPARKYR